MLPEGSRAKLGLVRKEQRWKLSGEEKVGEVLSGLDAGAESAASVTGNVGREAAEMSPVSGLDLGRTRWVAHGVECRREGGLWDPTWSREGGVCESPWTCERFPLNSDLLRGCPVLRRGCSPGPGRGDRELPAPRPPSSACVFQRRL